MVIEVLLIGSIFYTGYYVCKRQYSRALTIATVALVFLYCLYHILRFVVFKFDTPYEDSREIRKEELDNSKLPDDPTQWKL